jgi:hypothetical protein
MEIRVELPKRLVSRLHAGRRERDKQIRAAIEEYLAVPILDTRVKKEPRRATKT